MLDKYVVKRLNATRLSLAETAADLVTRRQGGTHCACVNGAMCEMHTQVYNLILEALENLDEAKVALNETLRELAG